jgi:ATP phosphoribosyltransferase
MSQLKLGLPKGSLEDATIELFRKSGWKITTNARSYFPSIDDPEITCSLVRAQEMSRYVAGGNLDCGITGKDWTLENASDVVVACDLVYSKVSLRPTRWVLAVPMDSPVRAPEDLAGKTVATELVNYTRRYFAERNVDLTVQFSWGATEAKAAEGLVDGIVEVTETGTTIRAHGLRIVCDLFESNPQLIVNRRAWGEGWKRQKVDQIRLLLQGALVAEAKVGLKMNVRRRDLDTVVDLIPSLTAPTVAQLYPTAALRGEEWLSVETVIAEAVARELIPRLQRAGAVGIIEYPLNKIV